MSISNYIQPYSVFLNMDVTDKNALLHSLFEIVEKTPAYEVQAPEVARLIRPMLLQRESYGSTAIGNGILFPHARVPGFNGLLIILATLRRTLDLPAPDGEPIFMVCLAVVPAERPSLALKVVSALSRLFAKEDARHTVRRAATPEEVTEYIAAHDIPIESVIQVGDIFRPYEWTATDDTPVREIARQLLQHRMQGVAVLDSAGELIGEVTLTRLQRFGLPNFFLSLKSVSFVRQFDPFEQYFLVEAKAVASHVMNTDAVCLPESGTLMEAIHTLAVKHRAMVHVCRGGRAVGYVDSAIVLNRVLTP